MIFANFQDEKIAVKYIQSFGKKRKLSLEFRGGKKMLEQFCATVTSEPNSFSTASQTEFTAHKPLMLDDFSYKGKKRKKGKKGKKARKKAAKRARKSAMQRQLAEVHFRCGYLAAENDLLRKMIALSVGVKRGSFNDCLAADGLKLIAGGER